MEALRLKRYKARIARRRKARKAVAKGSTARLAVGRVGKSHVLVNPYQSCRSKAVRTWLSNLVGNQILDNGNYYSAGTLTDMTGSVSLNDCGISAYWLRSSKAPDFLYLGVSVPYLDIRKVEDTTTLTALSQLYQYLKISNVNLTFTFDCGNVKNEVHSGGLVETGVFQHFSYPSQKGEMINISTSTGIMSDSAWEFISESSIKIHKTKSTYSLNYKPRFQLDPKTIIGSGATLPISIGNRSTSFDDIVAGNIPRMPSPAVVFKFRCPVSELAKMTIQMKMTVDYKSGGRVASGFDPTTPY